MNFISKLITIIIFFQYSFAQAHGGESHGSSPVASSATKFGNTTDTESPLSVGFKFRSGFEYGQFSGVLPSLNSYLGNEQINLNLNYEFQLREFSSSQQSEYADRDFNNHLSARIKKSLSDQLDFAITGEYEKRQAVRIARIINDYDYVAANSSIAYKLKNEWSVTAAYTLGSRQYPNGTYLVPSSSPTGAGEPIVPGTETTAKGDITLQGVTDNQNEIAFSFGGELGSQSMSLEGKYISNDSDLASRKFSAPVFKIALEKMLWSRILAQVAYAIENRIFSDRSDKINTTELGLQKELSARMSISAITRNNQTESIASPSTWEGYAQLQYVF